MELRFLLTEINSLTGTQNLPRRIELCEQALALISRDEDELRWAALHVVLGNSLAENPFSDRAENLERAIACYEAALEVFTPRNYRVEWAEIQLNLGHACQHRIHGDRVENLERAIAYYRSALSVLNEREHPFQWAMSQNNLADLYRNRLHGDRAENLERAITYGEAALQVFSRKDYPREWAMSQGNLGAAYLGRVRGDRAENLERAIAYCEAALRTYTREGYPIEWAAVQTNLGSAYSDRMCGDQAENLERAIAYCEAALRVYMRSVSPLSWAMAQNNLGNALRNRLQGNRAENLERAIDCYQGALKVRTRMGLASDRAATQYSLGHAFHERVQGDRADNLEQAIAYYQAALQVRTRKDYPDEWADTQNALGTAYRARVRGDRAENLEQAIASYQAALQVHTQEGYPLAWARIQNNLGVAYVDRIRGDRAENLEQAIASYRAALQVDTRSQLPHDWAMAQHNLGNALRNRILGDRAENLEQAIACYQAVLKLHTQKTHPLKWASAQHNLGLVYYDRVHGKRPENLARAIDAFRAALVVFESGGLPVDCRRTGRGLGFACVEAERWTEAAHAYQIALDAADVLYSSSLLRGSKEAELAATGDLHLRAAHAQARAGRLSEAAVTLERGRARALGEALARDLADLAAVARHDSEAYKAFSQAAERIRSLEASQWNGTAAAEAAVGTVAADQATAEATQQAQRSTLREEMQGARAELTEAVGRIRRLPGLEGFLTQASLADIVAVVEPGRPLIYLSATSAGSLTLLVHQPRGSPGREENEAVVVEAVEAAEEQPFSSKDFNDLLLTWNDEEIIGGYLAGQLGSRTWLEAALARLLPLLGERLVGPLAARLQELGAHGVTLVACGDLGLLPLHAATYWQDGQLCCLLDGFDVAYALSARVLGMARSTLPSREAGAQVLAGVGNPLPTPRPLDFAEAELEEVAACFEVARSFLGERATKQTLLAAAVGARYVHLACHGLFDLAEPLNSRLALARDQSLSLGEIIANRPFANARLVVASACQTAITEWDRLPDEAIGLPAGFLQAGTPGVIGTLWSVNDLSTALLMSRFYRYHLRGDPERGEGPMAPGRALRLAQRWLARVTAAELNEYIRQRPALGKALQQAIGVRSVGALVASDSARSNADDPYDRPFAAPYYWAPFVFVGT